MGKNRIAQVIGIAVFLVAAIIVSSALGLLSLPKGVQSVYYSVLFKVTAPQNSVDSLKSLHTATKAKHVNARGETVYTYKYSKEDRSIITRDSAKCEACHGSMLDKYDNGKPKHRIHTKMLTAPMLGFSCTDCHKKVDTRKRTPARPTFRVDRTLCPKCHDPSSPAPPSESTGGATLGNPNAPEMPNVFKKHGADENGAKKWIRIHPRIAQSVGIDKCRKCHQYGSELDFCRQCHLRAGLRPEFHRRVYTAKINEIYPDKKRTDVVKTNWRGIHFAFVRKALVKMGVKEESIVPQNLPQDKLKKLSCGACHVVSKWCTRCHIKHAPDWLDPNTGHPLKVYKFSRNICYRCHDTNGSKCQSCHTYAGRLYDDKGGTVPASSQN